MKFNFVADITTEAANVEDALHKVLAHFSTVKTRIANGQAMHELAPQFKLTQASPETEVTDLSDKHDVIVHEVPSESEQGA